jgi:acyl-CoA thioester hydrolase
MGPSPIVYRRVGPRQPDRYRRLVRLSVDPPRRADAYGFTHRIRVRFAETDAMGIVHHGSYLLYLETARVEYLRATGHPYLDVRAAGVDFAVLEVAVRYLHPLYFDDEVDVHVGLAAPTRATFQIAYLLTRADQAVATAVTVHGAVGPDGRPTRLPPWLRALMAR